MKREEILSVIAEWQNSILLIEGIKRDYENEIVKNFGSKPIKIITGFRRSGKSFLVLKVLKNLLESKQIILDNILYLNFEDFRLTSINSADNLNTIYQAFLTSISKKGTKIIILDEIQKVSNWDKFIRTIYEKKSTKKEDTEIILTGSNSELLSSEIGSNLAGRFIEFHIQPFSFKEFLVYSGLNVKSEQEYYRQQDRIKKYFYEYMKYGGLPEQFTINNEKAKYSYLEGIINKVILDDVIKRFNIKNPALIEKILFYQMANIGNKTSYSRIKQYAHDLGFDLKQETIVNYLEYLTKSFALIEVDKFDWKTKKVFSTSKKYYSIDLGLANLYKGLTSNFSRQLENLVLLNLKRNTDIKNIYYSIDKREIDFIAELRNGTFDKYQICQELTPSNKEREIDAFVQIDKYLKNTILTLEDNEEILEYKGAKIKKKNLIKYLVLSAES